MKGCIPLIRNPNMILFCPAYFPEIPLMHLLLKDSVILAFKTKAVCT